MNALFQSARLRLAVLLACLAVGLALSPARFVTHGRAHGQPTGGGAALHGQAALDQLKKEGSYASLNVALAAATTASGQSLQTRLVNQNKLTANDGAANDNFGTAVALSGDTAVIGAPLDDVAAAEQGSVYVFVRSGGAWTQQARLTASDGAAGDQLGNALALNGNTLVAGAANARVNGNQGQGAAYVFVRTGTSWSQQAKLTATDGAALDFFGAAVALSGDTAVIGAYAAPTGGLRFVGAAYVFVRAGTAWSRQARLVGIATREEALGTAVAINGDTLVAGAPNANDGQGVAYTFTRSGGVWTLQQRLTGNGGGPGDYFGTALSLSGDTLLVGAPGYDNSEVLDQGAAYVFTRNGGAWFSQARLVSDIGNSGDNFGQAVALHGDTAVIGAPHGFDSEFGYSGVAYAFLRRGTAWSQQGKLLPGDGANQDQFGGAVALSGDTVLAGARLADVSGKPDQGAAYLFALCGNLAPPQKLVANDGAAFDSFGGALALSADTLVVGAQKVDAGANVDQGAVYVFVRGSGGWSLQQKLSANDGQRGDEFGYAVALSGDTLAVGSPYIHSATGRVTGAVFIFVRSGTTWTRQAKLTTPSGVIEQFFGNSVALSGDTALVGVSGDNLGANIFQGSAYVFVRNGTNWTVQQKLTASDGVAQARFGYAVALRGDTAMIGSIGVNPGAVYVFTRSGATWSQQQKLTAADALSFGQKIALDDTTAVIGNARSSAYVFQRGVSGWSQQQKLIPPVNAAFGLAVAVSGNRLALGDESGGSNNQGTAYFLTQTGGSWNQERKLTADDSTPTAYFGVAVAVSAESLAVSASGAAIGANQGQGAVYVYGCAGCSAITLAPASLPSGSISTPYNQTIAASGGAGPYQFSLSDGALPLGLTLSAAGALTGTPAVAGTYSFSITATTPSLCTASRAYTLVVTGTCPAVTINPATLPNGTQSTPYNQALAAAGGTAPYTFAVTAGTLPVGLTLSAAGVLAGTPASFGLANFTVSATDAAGCRGLRAYTVNLAQFCPTLTLSPSTLPNARAGQAYSQTFTAAGGRAPYNFSATGLPAGLSLSSSGVLAGTPTTAGTYNLAVYLTDDYDCASVIVNYTLVVTPAAPAQARAKKGDFDGDGKADLAVWTGANSTWAVRHSATGAVVNTLWGAGYAPYFDVLVPGDYDGDGKQDHAVWRGQDSLWYIKQSSNGQAVTFLWGANYAPYFDIPTPGDFDGDGKTDIAVWRPTNGTFYVKRSSDGAIRTVAWGQQGDTPVAADYDGDGTTDFAVWRGADTNWYILKSSGGTLTIPWGAGYAPYFDVPVVADYDGDGKADPAIWRGQDSLWYIKQSSNGQAVTQLWGANYAPYFDVPVPADYDGDGKADIAVWRPLDGTWYIRRSADNTIFTQAHGQRGDTPVPAHGVK